MKNFYFVFLFLVGLLGTNFCVFSQNDAGYTTCGSVTACPGTYITVPISISGSPVLRAISMRIDYDGDVLSYMEPTTTSPPLNPPFSSLNVGLYNAFGNIMSHQNYIAPNNYRNVKIPWGMYQPGTVTTNGTGLLFNLIFYYYGGTTTLHFNNSSQYGGDCEYADANWNPLYDNNGYTLPYYIDGTVGPTSISGQFTYDDGYNTGKYLDSLNLNLLVPPWNYPSDVVCTTWTDINGDYAFTSNTNYCIGNIDYMITANTTTWGGVNVTDAVQLSLNYLPPNTPSSPYDRCMRWNAADVDFDLNPTSNDKQEIMDRWAGTLGSFARGDWFFEKNYNNPASQPTCGAVPGYYDNIVTYTGTNIVQNFLGLCVGDVNGSYIVPQGAKTSYAKVVINHSNNVVYLKPNEYFELPVKVSDSITVAAISLILKYPKDLVEINDVKFVNNRDSINPVAENVVYNINATGLRIGWIENNEAIYFNADEEILLIKATTKNPWVKTPYCASR